MDEVQGHNTDMEEPIQEELMKSSLRMPYPTCRVACLETSRAGNRQWKKSGVGGECEHPQRSLKVPERNLEKEVEEAKSNRGKAAAHCQKVNFFSKTPVGKGLRTVGASREHAVESFTPERRQPPSFLPKPLHEVASSSKPADLLPLGQREAQEEGLAWLSGP